MKRFGLIIILCLFLTGCGHATPAQEPEPVVENTDNSQVEEIEEPEEIKPDIIPDQYAYSLTIKINPEVKLYFDASDIIVGIEYKNTDAIDAYADLKIVGASSDEGLCTLIDAASEKNYLKEDSEIFIELTDVIDEQAVTDATLLLRAQEIISEHIKSASVSTEDTNEEEMQDALHIDIQIDVAASVTNKTGIRPVVVCPDCNGTGNDCKECNGTAIVNCKRCNGGWEVCGICNGSGHEICHGCKGSGIDNMGGTCNRCGGAGKQSSCTGCHGAGGFNCSWCSGALQHICPECWGEQVCQTCGGKGTL